jgi:gas vesicle protein
MEKDEMNENKGFAALCFLTGLATGIAVMALFAPRSGAATRRLIGHKVDEGKDWVKDQALAAQDYVKDQGKELQNRVKEAAQAIARG